MATGKRWQRAGAGVVAVVAWTGLGLLLADQARRMGSMAAALWANLRFFTDLSNLLIAVVFSILAVAPHRLPRPMLGMPLASTLMASAVFYGLLGGASVLGANGPGDVIAHAVTPLLVTGYWLLGPADPPFRYADIARWAVFPLAYCAYAIGRGLIDGRFPYFFLNVARLGVTVLLYIAAILMLFAALGAVVVTIDRARSARRQSV